MPDYTPSNPTGAPQNNLGGAAKAPTTETLKSDANALVDKAKNEFGTVASEAKGQVASLADQAKAQAAQLADQAKAQVAEGAEKLKGMAGEQKDMLVNQVTGVSDALQKVATELEQNNSTGAQYARMVADSAARFTETVENKNVDELLDIAQDFGRKQPAAFIGAAALLGFAASRFLLASAKRREQTAADEATMNTGYESQSSGYQPQNSGYQPPGSSYERQTTSGSSTGQTGGYTPSSNYNDRGI